MDKPKTYCELVSYYELDNPHRIYHDTVYGFRFDDDNELFGMLILEINQAGLSWNTIINKQENFRKAYFNYNIKKIASFKDADKVKLLDNTGIIRNRLKIDAAVYNANVVLKLQKECGSFRNWLDSMHPKSKEEWVKVFKKIFKFIGGEIVNEFLMCTGYLPGAHVETCPVYKKSAKSKPAWLNKPKI